MCAAAGLMLIWPLQMTFFTSQRQTTSVILVSFIAAFFYYTVTGGRGIIEVRQWNVNVTEGGAHHESQGLKKERGEGEIKAD